MFDFGGHMSCRCVIEINVAHMSGHALRTCAPPLSTAVSVHEAAELHISSHAHSPQRTTDDRGSTSRPTHRHRTRMHRYTRARESRRHTRTRHVVKTPQPPSSHPPSLALAQRPRGSPRLGRRLAPEKVLDRLPPRCKERAREAMRAGEAGRLGARRTTIGCADRFAKGVMARGDGMRGGVERV